MANYYIVRIDYDEHYDLIRKELIINRRLHQGWGAPGMTLNGTLEEFKAAWIKQWPNDRNNTEYIARKYINLRMMLEIQTGDIILIPKVSDKDKNKRDCFTLLKCNGQYEFSTIYDDYGHVIPVETMASFSYNQNDTTRIVSAKMKAYRKAVNRVYNEVFINAIDVLLSACAKDIDYCNKSDLTSIEALITPTSEQRKVYLQAIVDRINHWQPQQLESIIEELFEKNGYEKIGGNRFDKQGGDIDLLFNCFSSNTLMGDIITMSHESFSPDIRVQAKKKKGKDSFDIEGVLQLQKSEGYQKAINILINLTSDFSEEARQLAERFGVVLINGIEFADLLVRYGIDVSIER